MAARYRELVEVAFETRAASCAILEGGRAIRGTPEAVPSWRDELTEILKDPDSFDPVTLRSDQNETHT